MQQKTTEAESALRQGAQLAPKNLNMHMVLASFLTHQGKRAEAEAEYRKVLQAEPNNPMALNNIGYSMVERGEKLEEAREMIQRAVDAQPGNGYHLDSLGWAYFKLGKLDEAERYLNQAAQINSASATVQEHLGALYERKGKTAEARAAWQKALSLSSDSEQVARLNTKLATGDKKSEEKKPQKK
jgi:Flp pilus assembly protein TadD